MISATSRWRAIAFGVLAALGTAVVWALAQAVLSLHFGLLVIGAFGGWLIGSVVRAVGGNGVAWAVGLALATGLLATILDFAVSQLLLPAAATNVADRLTVGGYLNYLGGTFDVIEAVAVALLVIVAWRSAR